MAWFDDPVTRADLDALAASGWQPDPAEAARRGAGDPAAGAGELAVEEVRQRRMYVALGRWLSAVAANDGPAGEQARVQQARYLGGRADDG